MRSRDEEVGSKDGVSNPSLLDMSVSNRSLDEALQGTMSTMSQHVEDSLGKYLPFCHVACREMPCILSCKQCTHSKQHWPRLTPQLKQPSTCFPYRMAATRTTRP